MSDVALSLTEYVRETVKCLVDNQEKIEIREENGDRTTILTISVAKEDVGKIIGKQGTIISSIRRICENIAAKNNKRVNIHVLD